MAVEGNAQEGSGEEKVGALGDTGTADVRVCDPTRGDCMVNNVIYLER